jgi:hypothetical protein
MSTEKHNALLHTIALLHFSGGATSSGTLEAMGCSTRAIRSIVNLWKTGLLERHGKRGTGYWYIPTVAFWELYKGMSMTQVQRRAAKILATGARLDDICDSATRYARTFGVD